MQPSGLFEDRDRVIESAGGLECDCQVAVRLEISGLDSSGLRQIRNGFVGPRAAKQSRPAEQERFEVRGIGGQNLPVDRFGLVELARAVEFLSSG